MSSAYTADEVGEMLMDQLRGIALYWATHAPEYSHEERCIGVIHSVLVALEGNSGGLDTGFDLVARPNPSDKHYNIENGANYFEDGTVAESWGHELLYGRTGA